MNIFEVLNETLIFRERCTNSLPINHHGWSILTVFDWRYYQAIPYYKPPGSPLMPTLAEPTGFKRPVRLDCDTAGKLYEKQEISDFSVCTTANEHKTVWNTSEAVKRSIEIYKIRDYYTWIEAIYFLFTKSNEIPMQGIKSHLPFMEGIESYGKYQKYPDLTTRLNIDTMKPMTGEQIISYVEVRP